MMHASAAVGQSAASTNPEAGKAAVQVALIQFHSASANPAENQAKAEGFVREAARNGAQFILLPELYRYINRKYFILVLFIYLTIYFNCGFT
jgi:hypothetical protein